MSDSNTLTTYSWAASLFQQGLSPSLMDVENRANLVAEINVPLIQGNSRTSSIVNILLADLDSKEKNLV